MKPTANLESLIRLHLRAGWGGFLLFLLGGVVLEALHAIKAPAYLDVGNSSRRLMWTLAHSHGTLLSLMQIGFVATIRSNPEAVARFPRMISWGLVAGQFLLPLGFLLGGVWLQGGEPGPGVFVVPVGAGFLVAGVGALVWNVFGRRDDLERLRRRQPNPLTPAETRRLWEGERDDR
ncbi:MAG: hypothetical protein AB7J34_26095 [Limisphaerales bacterium]